MTVITWIAFPMVEKRTIYSSAESPVKLNEMLYIYSETELVETDTLIILAENEEADVEVNVNSLG